jgi:hypothetical protein
LGPHGEESSHIGPPEILRHPYASINAHRPRLGEAGCARSLSGENVTAAATGVRLSYTSLQELSGLADQWENSTRPTNRKGDPVSDDYGVRRGSCSVGNAVTTPPVFYCVPRPPMEEQRWDLRSTDCAAQPTVSNQMDRTTGSFSTTDV